MHGPLNVRCVIYMVSDKVFQCFTCSYLLKFPNLYLFCFTLRHHSLGLSIIFFLDLMDTGCPRRNGQNFGRVFLMLNYTDIAQNTYEYIQS